MLIEPLAEWCMSGRNVTPCLSRTHSAVLYDEGIQTYHIHTKKAEKPIANVKQWVVWKETCGPSPEIPINEDEDQSSTNEHSYKHHWFPYPLNKHYLAWKMGLLSAISDNLSEGIRWQPWLKFIYQPRHDCPDGEGENVWKRRRETTKMDRALEHWAYCNPASVWTCSGVSLIVLANGQPKF